MALESQNWKREYLKLQNELDEYEIEDIWWGGFDVYRIRAVKAPCFSCGG